MSKEPGSSVKKVQQSLKSLGFSDEIVVFPDFYAHGARGGPGRWLLARADCEVAGFSRGAVA